MNANKLEKNDGGIKLWMFIPGHNPKKVMGEGGGLEQSKCGFWDRAGGKNVQSQNENAYQCTGVPHVQSAGEFNTIALEKQPSPRLASITHSSAAFAWHRSHRSCMDCVPFPSLFVPLASNTQIPLVIFSLVSKNTCLS